MPTDDLIQAFADSEKARLRNSAIAFILIFLTSAAVIVYTSSYVRRAVAQVSQAKRALETVILGAKEEEQRQENQRRELEEQLRNAREATQYVSEGINFYHQGNYTAAVESYGLALKLDPRNPFILNLNGYALFKKRDYTDAVTSLERSVEADPDYAWGYFDLARVQCAVKDFNRARGSISTALLKRPDLRNTMRSDGEFTRLCAPISDAYNK